MRTIIFITCAAVFSGLLALGAARSKGSLVYFIKSLRPSRHIYYSAVFLLGYLAALRPVSGETGLLTGFFPGLLLINLLFMFSLLINNISDRKIDSINKKPNTLNTPGLKIRGFTAPSIITAGASLLLSSAISLRALLITALILITACAYSMKPFRLKRVFLLNTAVIAFSSVLALLLGYYCAPVNTGLAGFPAGPVAAFFICITLAFNTKDVNDYAGDKKYGIRTIMTVAGKKRGRTVIASLSLAGYLLMPALLCAPGFFAVSAAFGAATFFSILLPRSRINEPLIFFLFFCYAAAFMLLNPLGF